MIYFDGADTAERVWRCDYVARRPQGLGFDGPIAAYRRCSGRGPRLRSEPRR